MTLLSPIWLLALAAIGIPVVIHLWNIKPGKTLKVGSIALFSESSPKSNRSFKLQDILLLVLRCLLLALIAFLLAAPFIQQQFNSGKAKGWILIPEVNLPVTYKHFQPKIDSLTKVGYEFHYFRSDFKKDDLTELLKTYPDPSSLHDSLNYWTLSKQISTSVPIEIFTPNSAYHFTGYKPQIGRNINWNTYTSADSISTWIAGAWLTNSGDIRVMERTATPSGTNYQYLNIKNGNSSANYTVAIENGVPIISSKNIQPNKIKVDTDTHTISIYTDRYILDANYLRSALEAIGQLTQQKTVIKLYNNASALPAGQDWVFWLSDKPIPSGVAAKNIFQYQDGKLFDINTQLVSSSNYTIGQSQTNIPIHKSTRSRRVGEAVWSDGFGDAVLSFEKSQTNAYHFYSRFNPAWSDLVWSDEFPKWLMELTNNIRFTSQDKRSISAEQLKPEHINTSDKSMAPPTQPVSLVNYLWIALALVFIVERWLATKNNTVIANG